MPHTPSNEKFQKAVAWAIVHHGESYWAIEDRFEIGRGQFAAYVHTARKKGKLPEGWNRGYDKSRTKGEVVQLVQGAPVPPSLVEDVKGIVQRQVDYLKVEDVHTPDYARVIGNLRSLLQDFAHVPEVEAAGTVQATGIKSQLLGLRKSA